MKIKAFQKTFDGRTVLSVPELDIEDGKIIAILGTNGSGKSTFARIVSKILKADGNEKSVTMDNLKIGYLPQKPYVFNMSLEKNMNIIGGDSSDMMKRLKIDNIKDENGKKLSGGEAAKLSLGRILKKEFNVLFLDEPTSEMDIESTLMAEELIKEYAEKTGATVFVITHELKQAKRMSDYVIFFDEGKLRAFGETGEVINNPKDERLLNFITFYGA